MNEWVANLVIASAGPLIGWVIYVERRLSVLENINSKVETIDARVEKLVDHLIGQSLDRRSNNNVDAQNQAGS